ncbi:MAG: HepT-like ribonuclease domain-containing protein [Desulfobacterales bacterium]
MSQHNDEIRFRDMLDHAREALSMVRGKKRSDLDSERMLELSLVRLVEIIGEAAVRVRNESREKYPSIPWLQIVGMRNRLVHGYDAVDLDVLWNTIIHDLPPLIVGLEKILFSKKNEK